MKFKKQKETEKVLSQGQIQRNLNNMVNQTLEDMDQKRKKAVQEKRKGNYKRSLELWDEVDQQINGIDPKVKAGKGKILILLDRVWDAKEEFEKCLIWFTNNYNKKMDQLTEENCIGAIGHLGYCIGTGMWTDESQYLKSIAGQGGNPSQQDTISRMQAGLLYLKQNSIWCPVFDNISYNIGIK